MYEIIGKYKRHPWEVLDEAETRQERDYLLSEYRMAFGAEWRIEARRVRKKPAQTHTAL